MSVLLPASTCPITTICSCSLPLPRSCWYRDRTSTLLSRGLWNIKPGFTLAHQLVFLLGHISQTWLQLQVWRGEAKREFPERILFGTLHMHVLGLKSDLRAASTSLLSAPQHKHVLLGALTLLKPLLPSQSESCRQTNRQ